MEFFAEGADNGGLICKGDGRFHDGLGSFDATIVCAVPSEEKYHVCWRIIPFEYGSTTMELRHLRYFVTVAEERGITKAAARLNVSQPPLSRQIRDLEDELQVPLLDRSAKQIELTPAGKMFLRDARAVLQRMDDAVRRVRSLPQGAMGEIRVGYSPSPTTELLPRVLKTFRKMHPKTRVVLLDLASNEILAGLKARQLDVAIVIEPPLKKGSGLVFEALQQMPIGVMVSNDHEFARRRSVTLDEVLGEPVVAFIRKGYPDYHHWLKGVIQFAKRRPRIVASADGATSLMAAVESGQGIAFGPPAYAIIAGKRAKFVPIKPAAPPIKLGALTRTGRSTPLMQAFLKVLRLSAKM